MSDPPLFFFGTLPKVSSCPANGNGYKPHETDGRNPLITMSVLVTEGQAFEAWPCKHCGALFLKYK